MASPFYDPLAGLRASQGVDPFADPLAGLSAPTVQDPLRGLSPDVTPRPMSSPPEKLPELYGDNEFTKGLRRGFLGTEATTQAYGAQLTEPFSAKQADAMFAEANRKLNFDRGLRPQVETWDDVHGPGDFLQYGLSKAGEALPSTITSLGAAGLGGAASLGLRALTGGRVNLPLGFLAGAGSMLPQEAGEAALTMHNDAVARANTTPWQRLGLATAKGGINAALEFTPEALALRRAFGAPSIRRGFGPAIGEVGKGLAEAATGEAITEGLQEKTGQIFQGLANPQRDTRQDWTNIREAMLGGAFGGAGLGAVSGGIHALRSNLPQLPEAPPEATAYEKGYASGAALGDATIRAGLSLLRRFEALGSSVTQGLKPSEQMPPAVGFDLELLKKDEATKARLEGFDENIQNAAVYMLHKLRAVPTYAESDSGKAAISELEQVLGMPVDEAMGRIQQPGIPPEASTLKFGRVARYRPPDPSDVTMQGITGREGETLSGPAGKGRVLPRATLASHEGKRSLSERQKLLDEFDYSPRTYVDLGQDDFRNEDDQHVDMRDEVAADDEDIKKQDAATIDKLFKEDTNEVNKHIISAAFQDRKFWHPDHVPGKTQPYFTLRFSSDSLNPQQLMQQFTREDSSEGKRQMSEFSPEEIAFHTRNGVAELPVNPMALVAAMSTEYGDQLGDLREGQTGASNSRKGDVFMTTLTTLINEGVTITDAEGRQHHIEVDVSPESRLEKPVLDAEGTPRVSKKTGQVVKHAVSLPDDLLIHRNEQAKTNYTVGQYRSEIASKYNQTFRSAEELAMERELLNTFSPIFLKDKEGRGEAKWTAAIMRHRAKAAADIASTDRAVRAQGELRHKLLDRIEESKKYPKLHNIERWNIRNTVADAVRKIETNLEAIVKDIDSEYGNTQDLVEQVQDYFGSDGREVSANVKKLFKDNDIQVFNKETLTSKALENNKGMRPQDYLLQKLEYLHKIAKEKQQSGVLSQSEFNAFIGADAEVPNVPGIGNTVWDKGAKVKTYEGWKGIFGKAMTKAMKIKLLRSLTNYLHTIDYAGKWRIQGPSGYRLGFFETEHEAQKFIDDMPADGYRLVISGHDKLAKLPDEPLKPNLYKKNYKFDEITKVYPNWDAFNEDTKTHTDFARGASIVNPETGEVLELSGVLLKKLSTKDAIKVLKKIERVTDRKNKLKVVDATPLYSDPQTMPIELAKLVTEQDKRGRVKDSTPIVAEEGTALEALLKEKNITDFGSLRKAYAGEPRLLTVTDIDKLIRIVSDKEYNAGLIAATPGEGTQPIEKPLRSKELEENARERLLASMKPDDFGQLFIPKPHQREQELRPTKQMDLATWMISWDKALLERAQELDAKAVKADELVRKSKTMKPDDFGNLYQPTLHTFRPGIYQEQVQSPLELPARMQRWNEITTPKEEKRPIGGRSEIVGSRYYEESSTTDLNKEEVERIQRLLKNEGPKAAGLEYAKIKLSRAANIPAPSGKRKSAESQEAERELDAADVLESHVARFTRTEAKLEAYKAKKKAEEEAKGKPTEEEEVEELDPDRPYVFREKSGQLEEAGLFNLKDEGREARIKAVKELGKETQEEKKARQEKELAQLNSELDRTEGIRKTFKGKYDDKREMAFSESTKGYGGRTDENATADATIAIAADFLSGGEKRTKRAVEGAKKKYIDVRYNGEEKASDEAVNRTVEMLNEIPKEFITLNIAGNGIYSLKKIATQDKVDAYTQDFLRRVTEHSDLKKKVSSVRTGGQTGFDEAGAKAGRALGIPTEVHAPLNWEFRIIDEKEASGHRDIKDEAQFKARFDQAKPVTTTTTHPNKPVMIDDPAAVQALRDKLLTNDQQQEFKDALLMRDASFHINTEQGRFEVFGITTKRSIPVFYPKKSEVAQPVSQPVKTPTTPLPPIFKARRTHPSQVKPKTKKERNEVKEELDAARAEGEKERLRFLKVIKNAGGLLPSTAPDVIREKGIRINQVGGGIFRRGGHSLDRIIEVLLAKNYMTQEEIDSDPKGGEDRAIELINIAIKEGGIVAPLDIKGDIEGRITAAEEAWAEAGKQGAAVTAENRTAKRADHHITREEIQANPDTIYVFGDNRQRRGYGGAAEAARDEPNAIGVITKKAPARNEGAYLNDAEFLRNKKDIDADFAKIPKDKNVVFMGPGENLAQLKTRAPRTWDYLQSKIRELTGEKAPEAAAPTTPTAVAPGENIASPYRGRNTGYLARALTNVTYHNYPVDNVPGLTKPREGHEHKMSAEAWYFTNTKRDDSLQHKMEVMQKIIEAKLRQKYEKKSGQHFTDLIKAIDDMGGAAWIEASHHTVTGKGDWEGQGLESNFLRVLHAAYNAVKEVKSSPLTPAKQAAPVTPATPPAPIKPAVSATQQGPVGRPEGMFFSMPAKDNVTGEATTTLKLIQDGIRTATTRHWPRLPKVGEILSFHNYEKTSWAHVEVTGVSPRLGVLFEGKDKNKVLTELSKAEGWTPEAFIAHYADGKGRTVNDDSRQVSFKLIGKPTPKKKTLDITADFSKTEHYRKKEGLTQEQIEARKGKEVQLAREPDNKYDPNAIKVMVDGVHHGYVPKETAAKLAPYLDKGKTGVRAYFDENNHLILERTDLKASLQSTEIHRELGRKGFPATHDSPIRHEGKFNWRANIGRGQGAASFGAGTYLSTAEGVHKSYKQEFTEAIAGYQADKSEEFNPFFERFLENPDAPLTLGLKRALVKHLVLDISKLNKKLQDLRLEMEKPDGDPWASTEFDQVDIDLDRQKALLKYIQTAELGKPITERKVPYHKTSPTYHVSVDIDPTHLLDWDKPFSQQSKFVQKALEKEGFLPPNTFEPAWEMDGVEATDELEESGEEKYLERWRADGDGDRDNAVGYVYETNNGKWEATEYTPNVLDDSDNFVTHKKLYDTREEAQEALKPFLQGGLTGEDIYNRISDKFRKGINGGKAQAMASDALQKAGILGHRYNSSGGTNAKFPNYVIYDDAKIHSNYVSFSGQKQPTPGWTPARATRATMFKQLQQLMKVMFGDKVQLVETLPAGVSGTAGRGWYESVRGQLDALKANEAELKNVRDARREALDAGNTAEVARLEAREAKLLKQEEALGTIYLNPTLAIREMLPTYYHESTHAAFDILLTPAERAIMATAFSQGTVRRQLEKIFAGDPAVLKQMKDDPEEAAAYGFQIYAASPHLLQLGPKVETIFQKVLAWFKKMLGILSPEQKAQVIMNDLLAGRLADKGLSPLQRVLDKDMTLKQKINKHATAAKDILTKLWEVVASPSYDRLIKMNNPAIAAFAKLGFTKTGEKGDLGMIQLQQNEFSARLNWINNITKKYTVEQLRAVADHRMKGTSPTEPELIKAYKDVDAFFNEFRKYAKDAGINIGFIKNYWPMLWDAEKVMKNRDEFLKMVSRPKYAAELAKLKVTPTELWENISGYVTRGDSFQGIMGPKGEPINAYSQERSLSFLDADDRKPFMKDTPVETMVNYVSHMVRQAEFVRRYGVEGKKGEALLKEAEHKYGATPEQITLAKDYLDGLLGNKEVGMSRELKDLYGAAVVYQNYRLLPFNLFTSFVDPLGIAIRSGRIGDALETFGYAMKKLFRDLKKEKAYADKDRWEQLAIDFGYIEDAGTMANLRHMMETTELRGFTKTLNDNLFKWNLLNGWTRSTKIMAVKAGQRFIARIAKGTDATSIRHMEELGLKPSDVMETQEGNIALRKDEFMAQGVSEGQAEEMERRMRDAMTKFVNQAILNPTAADLPSWGSNPYLAPIFHLKQFMFTFQTTILSRIWQEAKEGNMKPLWISGIYIPGMIGADAIRGFVSNMGDEPPWQKDWGPVDYVKNGVSRSGLLGSGQMFASMWDDVMHGGRGYESAVGPTVEQFMKGLQAAGKGDTALWNFTVKAMPLGPIYDQWLLSDKVGPMSNHFGESTE